MRVSLACIFLALSISATANEYESKVPGITLFGYTIGGLYKKSERPRPEAKPIDRTSEKLMNKGVFRIQYGLGLCLLSFTVSIMFANPVTARISNYGLIGGAVVAGDGFMLVFIAEYLIYFCIAVFAMFGVLVWARRKSIVTLIKGNRNVLPKKIS